MMLDEDIAFAGDLPDQIGEHIRCGRLKRTKGGYEPCGIEDLSVGQSINGNFLEHKMQNDIFAN